MPLNLITDRTQDDVDFAAANRDSASRLKGAYNAEDYNRVAMALNSLAGLVFRHGYREVPLMHNNWQETENFTPADGEKYLSIVRQLKEAYFTLPSTPPLPDSIQRLFESGGHIEANNIERFLLGIEQALEWMIASFHHANEFYAGEHVDIAGVRFGRRLTVGELEQFTVAYLEGFTVNEIEFGGAL